MLEILTLNKIFSLLGVTLIGFLYIELVFCLKKRGKQVTLIVGGASFLAVLDFTSFAIFCVLSSIIYLLVKQRISIKKNTFIICGLFLLVLFFLKNLSNFEVTNFYVPLGVSYYLFRLISFLFDYAKEESKYQQQINFYDFFSWAFFFPVLLAGPIQRFSSFVEIPLAEQSRSFRNKITLNLLGFFFIKFIIIDGFYLDLFGDYLAVKDVDASESSPLNVLLFGFFSFLRAYLDLMIYTEIAKGLGALLGYQVQENFNKPLLATNPSKFWQNYHISLSSWTRDYVFFPLLGKTRNMVLATYASMLMMGMWHNISLNWLAWGILHATGITIYNKLRQGSVYKFILKQKHGVKLLTYGGRIITASYIGFVFIFVSISDFNEALGYALRVFGL